MKKYITITVSAVLAALFLAACGAKTDESSAESAGIQNEKQLQIVTTIFPEYDWVREILGENSSHAELTMLLDNGVDLHSYQPTVHDMTKISDCDLFIYVGGESDSWVEDALAEAANKEMKVINLLEVLGDSVKEEEVVEGMEAEHEAANGAAGGIEKLEAGEAEYDEHVWLSLKNAEVLCRAIGETLAEIDPAGGGSYRANTEAYCGKLAGLDAEYETAVAEASQKTVLFGDRFPFRYLADDYGLSYYAAFVGCSAETEASFQTITFLAEKVDELGLNAILTIEKSDRKIAETIRSNTESKTQQILAMDSMQSVTSQDVSGGADYLSIMENNLVVLREALQ